MYILSNNIYNKNLKNFTPMEFAESFRECIEKCNISYNNTPICGEFSCPPQTDKYENPRPAEKNSFSEEINNLNKICIDLSTSTNYTLAHFCNDYESVINKGLIWYVKDIEERIKASKDEERKAYGEAMIYSLKACQKLSDRFKTIVPKENTSLQKALDTVPYLPAYDFLSACQSMWFMHNLVPMAEDSYGSISIGALDRFLYPFYLKDKDKYNEDYFVDILAFIFRQLQFNHDGACAVNIGGHTLGPKGINELSEIILKAERKVMGAAPIITVRVTKNTEDEFLLKFIDKDLFSIGQPTFYSEENCIKALKERGVSDEDIETFAITSCMGICTPGKDISDMWGCVINTHAPLEMAVNKGETFNKVLTINSVLYKEPNSIENILENYKQYFLDFLSKALKVQKAKTEYASKYYQNPLLSALLEGCRETLTDRAFMTVKYHNITVECMAFANTANALAIIYEKCFKERVYSLSDIKDACVKDFVRFEDLRKDILTVPKFGENTKEKYTADWFANFLTETFAWACKEQSEGNIHYVPSYHTLDTNVGYGLYLYSTLDGRIKGEPVNKNAGPTLATREASHTDVVLSVGNLPQYLMTGRQPLDLYFPANMLDGKNKEKVLSLIKTYLSLKGLQLQVNSANIELLEKAHKNPELYPNVIVRIGGYSIKFADMSKESRQEHIERAKLESRQY